MTSPLLTRYKTNKFHVTVSLLRSRSLDVTQRSTEGGEGEEVLCDIH